MENHNYVRRISNQGQQAADQSLESNAFSFESALTIQMAKECQKCHYYDAVYIHQQMGELCSKCQEYFGRENN